MRLVIALAFFLFAPLAMASPCTGIDQVLSPETKANLAPAIAKQMQAANVEVLRSFRGGEWSILYVNPHESDDAHPGSRHGAMNNRVECRTVESTLHASCELSHNSIEIFLES